MQTVIQPIAFLNHCNVSALGQRMRETSGQVSIALVLNEKAMCCPTRKLG